MDSPDFWIQVAFHTPPLYFSSASCRFKCVMFPLLSKIKWKCFTVSSYVIDDDHVHVCTRILFDSMVCLVWTKGVENPYYIACLTLQCVCFCLLAYTTLCFVIRCDSQWCDEEADDDHHHHRDHNGSSHCSLGQKYGGEASELTEKIPFLFDPSSNIHVSFSYIAIYTHPSSKYKTLLCNGNTIEQKSRVSLETQFFFFHIIHVHLHTFYSKVIYP